MWYLYVIAAIGGFLFAFVVIAMSLKYLGTLVIDINSRNDRDIARFVFDTPLDEARKHGLMLVKIEETKNGNSLSSMDGRL